MVGSTFKYIGICAECTLGIDATPEKITSQMSKCKATTSFDTGMRLCGMQVIGTAGNESNSFV